MTTLTLNPFKTSARNHGASSPLDLNPLIKWLVISAGTLMTALCAAAIIKAMLGLSGELPHLRSFIIVFHVVTVLPCVPLGLYLLITRKGTSLHKQLGKLWVALMVITALSTLFIRPGMEMTWIHIFVPITLRASYLIITKARKGDIKGHRNEIVSLYLGALMLPGIAAFVIPGRLMNVMLFGW